MRKNIFLFIGIIVFVALFYHQTIALNLSIFCALIWCSLLLTTVSQQRDRTFWYLSAATFIAIVAFAWYGDFLSFIALFVSLTAISYKIAAPQLNMLLLPVIAFLNYLSFPIKVLNIGRWLPVKEKLGLQTGKKIIAYFIIPAFFTAAFIIIYAAGSKNFLSFFTFSWQPDITELIILIAIGFFFMFNFYHQLIPGAAYRYNSYLSDDFRSPQTLLVKPTLKFFDLKFERKSGEITLILLNLLLIFFIITYNIEHSDNIKLHKSVSAFELYARVYAVIFSIVMAIAIIMFYFKGAFNFDKDAGLLKKLAIIWIFLNAVLVISVAIANNQYIYYSGLTFKRIGIYIFLILCLVGLMFTFLKLKHRKTNLYLVNRMVWSTFILLILGAIINWSWVVTKYNLTSVYQYDKEYVYNLPYNKQLLYKSGLITKAALSAIKTNEHQSAFLSQKLYYEFLKTE